MAINQQAGVYDWQNDSDNGLAARAVPGGTAWRTTGSAAGPERPTPPRPRPRPSSGGASRAAGAAGAAAGGFVGAMSGSVIPPVNVNINRGSGNGGKGNGGGAKGTAGTGDGGSGVRGDMHQGDRLIAKVERIELANERDVIALCRAINHLGRELHLILGMRAEELQAVLGQYKSPWNVMGTASRVRARLVAAHLKVAAEAAKALGVAALKAAHAFDRHFVKPEQEARRKAQSQKAAPRFTIGDV